MPKPSLKAKASDDKTALQLKEEVANVYELSEGVLMIFCDNEFGFIDLSKIDIEFAHRLADRGYLKKKNS